MSCVERRSVEDWRRIMEYWSTGVLIRSVYSCLAETGRSFQYKVNAGGEEYYWRSVSAV
jgi:hypothetical protein